VNEALQRENDECTTTAALSASSSSAAALTSSSVALTSLAPQYEKEHHSTYLNRLDKAVEAPKNLNIALTGRYGAGKSSVLDRFEEPRKSTTLRLAISTLGPNGEGATLTNRIQKELVKQLVYSPSPRTMRHSHFRRSVALPWHRALGEAAAAVTLLGAILALLGWLPPVARTGVDKSRARPRRRLGWTPSAARRPSQQRCATTTEPGMASRIRRVASTPRRRQPRLSTVGERRAAPAQPRISTRCNRPQPQPQGSSTATPPLRIRGQRQTGATSVEVDSRVALSGAVNAAQRDRAWLSRLARLCVR
jgi:hypothetical protein